MRSLHQSPLAVLLATGLLLSPITTRAQVITEVAHGALEDKGEGVPQLEVERELIAEQGGFTKVLWSSDGTKLAAYMSVGDGYSDAGNRITVWEADGKPDRELSAKGWAFTSTSPLAFVTGDMELVTPPPLGVRDVVFSVYNLVESAFVRQGSGPPLRAPGARIDKQKFAVSPNRSLIAVPLGELNPVALYSTKDWKEVTTLPEPPRNEFETSEIVAFSPNGRFLGWNRGSHELAIYNLPEKMLRKVSAFPEPCCQFIGGIAFNPGGDLVAVSSPTVPGKWSSNSGIIDVEVRDPVRVFRTEDGTSIAAFHEAIPKIRHLAWSPDGRTVAFTTGADVIRFWDPVHAEDPGRAFRLRGAVMSLAFSPDGSHLAVANGGNLTIFRVKP